MATAHVLHYGSEVFDLAEAEEFHDLANRISAKLDGGGGWVDVGCVAGGVTIWVSPGIPIWFDRRNVPGYSGPQRIR